MTETTDLFLITGATGKTGIPTVELLRERGFRVRAFVRTVDDRATRLRELNAEVVQGDLLDIDAASSARVGVTAAYFCYPIDPPRLLEATAIFAQAATEAGVGAVVNMSQSDVFAGTSNLVEAIGGTPPMTVEQYTTTTRTSFESQGQYAAWASVA
jgi:uncharacterized protein YbjT (DUF2867 family)